MIKKLTSLAIALFFTVTTASISLAASLTCKVTSVNGSTVILNCGSKAKKLKKNGKATVKTEENKNIAGSCG